MGSDAQTHDLEAMKPWNHSESVAPASAGQKAEGKESHLREGWLREPLHNQNWKCQTVKPENASHNAATLLTLSTQSHSQAARRPKDCDTAAQKNAS